MVHACVRACVRVHVPAGDTGGVATELGVSLTSTRALQNGQVRTAGRAENDRLVVNKMKVPW